MKITSSVRLYIAAIIAGGSVVIAAAVFSFYKASDVQSVWFDFNQSRSEKNRVLNALRQQIGFGGMIHNYKNYILRKDLLHKEKVFLSLGGAKATLSRYKILPLNEEELIAINNIANTLLSYESALEIVDAKIKLSFSAKQIDKIVKIDDAAALVGLESLEKNTHLYLLDNNSTQVSKSHLITSIRQELGYGGMIHFYKNYILRHDAALKVKAAEKMNLSLQYLESYSAYELNIKEKDALNVLTQYLRLYKERLNQLENYVMSGLSPREIDKRVVVDDKPISNALAILEQQTILYDEVRVNNLNSSIGFIVSSTKFIGAVTFVIFILIAAGSYWFVRLRVVKPIVGLISVMKKLSGNDFDVKIIGTDSNNEIGDMAKSIEDFRDISQDSLDMGKELFEINSQLEQRVEERTRKLEDNQKLLNAIVETAVDAIIVIDDKGIIKSFNAAAVKMFGYEKGAAIGENINIFIPEDEKQKHQYYLDNYKDKAEENLLKGKGREVIAIRKNGKKFPIEVAIGELILDKRKMFTGIIRDISDRRFQEEQIRRSQKMDALGKLTGGIAHDYNNMLGIVMGYAELLKMMLTDDKLSSYADEIYKAGERGENLTNKLLDFSRHKPNQEKELVNINTLLINLKSMLKKTLTARIELDYHFVDEPWDVNIDVADFENALLNMFINAMHAISEAGTLTIRTENILVDNHLGAMLEVMSGDYIKLSVTDTGCGMDEETKKHIFDPFYSTKEDKSRGFGLSQVYGFVQRSDGAIKVYSEPQKGTNFTIYLPRQIDSETANNESNVIDNDLRGNEFILIVDDEPALVVLAEEILVSFGYKTCTANDGFEALAFLEKNQNIDLMLSDVVMPKMDGFSLAKTVKEKYPNILIQLASGYNAVSSQAKEHFNDEDIISKPYSAQELVKKIRQLLDSK